MKLSPLRKQMQILNQELEEQNVQMRDLISFLNKSTPKNTHFVHKSPAFNLKSMLKIKNKFQESPACKQNLIQHTQNFKLKQNQSMKGIKPFFPITNQQQLNLKSTFTSKQEPMTKSIIFHNMKNALGARKYLKLSRPQKKETASCQFCRSQNYGVSLLECGKNIKVSSKDKRLNWAETSSNCNQCKGSSNISTRSKSKAKQKPNSDKKLPLNKLNSNEIMSKKQIRCFIENKSSKNPTNKRNNNSKLQLIHEKSSSTLLLKKSNISLKRLIK